MNENDTEMKNKLFQFDWSAFNIVAGIKFALAILVMVLLTTFTEFNFLIILIAAFLAWLTDVPGTTRNRAIGMVIFGAAGVATLWLTAVVFSNVLWFTIAMFVVAFLFTLPMALSQRGYMVGWVTILWFFSIAPMTGSGDVTSIMWDLLIGVGIVVLITLLWPAGIGPYGSAQAPDSADAGGVEDNVFVLVYALTVAVVMAITVFIGLNLFTVGAVWVANGAFFVLGPSTKQSWAHGIERAVVVVLGVFVGLLLIQLIDSTLILTLVVLFFATMALSALNAGYAVSIGSYTAGMTMIWAVQGLDVGRLNSSERILAEGLAIGLAIGATAFLQWWSQHRKVKYFVEAEIAT